MERHGHKGVEAGRRLRWSLIVLVGTAVIAVGWQVWIQSAFGDRGCYLEDCSIPILLMLLPFAALPLVVGALLAHFRASSRRTRLLASLTSNGATCVTLAVMQLLDALHATAYGAHWSGYPRAISMLKLVQRYSSYCP
jgi:hypothetical protein